MLIKLLISSLPSHPLTSPINFPSALSTPTSKEETSSSRTTRSSSGANCGSHDELLDKIAKLFKDYVEEKYSIDIDKSEILKILKYCFPEDKTNDENAQLYISTIKRYVSNSSTEYKKNLKEVLISYVNGDYDSKGIKNIRSLQDLGKDVKMAYFTLSVDEKDLINKYLKVNSEDIAFADKLNIFDENYKSGIITFLNQQDNIQSILVMILDTLSDIDYTNIIDLYRYLLSLLGKDDECFDFDDTAFFSIEPLKPEPPKKEYDSSLINMFFEEIIEKYKDNILNIILVCRHLFNHFNFLSKRNYLFIILSWYFFSIFSFFTHIPCSHPFPVISTRSSA